MIRKMTLVLFIMLLTGTLSAQTVPTPFPSPAPALIAGLVKDGFPEIHKAHPVKMKDVVKKSKFKAEGEIPVPEEVFVKIGDIIQSKFDSEIKLISEEHSQGSAQDNEKEMEQNPKLFFGPVYKILDFSWVKDEDLYVFRTNHCGVESCDFNLILYNRISKSCVWKEIGGSGPWHETTGLDFADLLGDGKKLLRIDTHDHCCGTLEAGEARFYSLDENLSLEEIYGFQSMNNTGSPDGPSNTFKVEIVKADHGTLTFKETNYTETPSGHQKPKATTYKANVKDFNKAQFEDAMEHLF